VIHFVASRRAGGKGTTPVLVADGQVLAESADIVRWTDPGLYPDPELPEPFASEVRRLREHPAGRFALRLYDEERP
jgi:glutathione S-transferase